MLRQVRILFLNSNIRRKETYTKNILEGKTKPYWLGKKHTKETKEKISKKMSAVNNGYIKCKFYEIYNFYTKKIVIVQGTWELKFAEWLNEQKIPWVKNRKLHLHYKYENDQTIRTYFPDFYLPFSKEFIEIKGYFYEDDLYKMQIVCETHKDKNILILQKPELILLGIKLN